MRAVFLLPLALLQGFSSWGAVAFVSGPSRAPGTRPHAPRRVTALGAQAREDKNFEEYTLALREQQQRRFQIICAPVWEELAERMEASYPARFRFHPSTWDKFPDGTDKIEIGGFQPHNVISGSNVIFLASFHNNDVTLSQFSVMVTLLQSFVESLTIILPYYPVGTMERVTEEGQVATANTYARMFSNLPQCGRPTRLMIYDLHTLQNRFYMSGNVIASLCTSVPCVIPVLREEGIDCVAFPDDGAAKRFKHMFDGFDIIVCGKVRDGDERRVTIQEGNARGKHVVIVDDLVQTGGTLVEAGKALLGDGAESVSAFVAHGVFPNEVWKRFMAGGDRDIFRRFWLSNSIPTTTSQLPEDDCFEVVDLMEKIISDLDSFSS